MTYKRLILREKGVITALDGAYALVQTQNQLACSKCQLSDSCGNGIIEKFFSGKIFITPIENKISAKVGDEVWVQIPKSSITSASLVVYLLPLIIMISLAALAQSLNFSESFIILFALFGLSVGGLVTKFYNRKNLNNESYLPSMVSVIDTRSPLQ